MATILTTGCKGDKENLPNPFFEEWTTPYGVPPFDRIRAYHYEPAFERAMSLHDEQIEAITAETDEPTFANTLAAYDASGRMLDNVSNIFSMLCAADTSERMQEIEERMMPRLAAHYDKILMNDALFARIKQVYDKRNSTDLTPDQLRLTEKVYDDFVRSGALLGGEDKARLKQINEELSVASVRFGNNILAENNAFELVLSSDDLDGLPASVRDAARSAAGEKGLDNKYLFTLHKPSLIPFLTYSSRRDLRKQMYEAYLNRCNRNDEYDNKQLVNNMIRLRTEKAHLLGYRSYAEYVTADQMAGSPKNVYALLDEIWTPALEKAKSELAEMEGLFRADFGEEDDRFESWDWWYYAEKLRKQNYALNEEMLRPYFSLDNVRQGVFNLANRLYALTFRPIAVPLYNEEVSAYEVLDSDESHLGVLYFDFFPRAGKGQGAWCGYFREPSRDADGNRIAPVVSIVCNFTRPSGSTPALLSIDETLTLFHEFGHALHFLFSDVPYNGLLDVEGDFVELPSQIMENFALEPEMLKTYAVHYRTNEIINNTYIGKIRRSALFNQGFATTELIAAALSDMDIHSTEKYEPIDVDGFEYNALYERRGMIPQIEPRYRYNYFAHIFSGGYSAGYYFYIWAEVLDKDAFEAFRESGDTFNRRIAETFRNQVLSRGGSADGMTLYTNFRGKEPDKTPMLKARGLWTEPEPVEDEIPAEDGEAAAGDATLRPMPKQSASLEFD